MARRFLFVLRTKLGDTLIHFQTVRAFAARHPADEVVLATHARYAPLLEGVPGLRIVPFRNRAEMVAKLLWLRLTRPSFDALAVLIGYGPAMLQIGRLVRARRRLFFDARFPDTYPEYPEPYDETSVIDRSWRTVRLLDPDVPRPDRLELPALRARRLATRRRTRAIGIVPLANELRRNLDAPTLVGLVARVRVLHPGAAVWIFINPDDRGAAELAAAPVGEGVEWRRFLTLEELVSQYLHLDGWYGTDTGLYHLAVGMGIPATVFFGPTQPQLYVMPAQAETTWIRLTALGAGHCDEKTCARPLCLHQAMASWSGAETSTRLEETPAACPLRAFPVERLTDITAHENPRHQA
jgi:ADP-heptose:LPS heptosyltransferase